SWRPGAWPLNRASGRHYNGSRQLSEMHHRRDQRGGRAMATKRVVATWLVGIALGVPAAGDETREVTGRVVAEDGRAVAGAEVATLWDALGGSQMRPFQASRTGQDGWFRLKVSFWQGHMPLMALNREHTRGGTTLVDGKSADKAVEIRLGP